MAKTAPQVPGEVTESPVPEVSTVPDTDATVTIDRAQLDALMAKAAQADAMARPVKAGDASLPDQSTIDPTAIKSPVLSKQGWVVPAEFGSNPAAKRL